MARKSIAYLEAELAAREAECLGLAEQVNELSRYIKHETVDIGEYRRVQRLLSTTQQFAKKYKDQAAKANGRGRVEHRRIDGETEAQRTIREHRERNSH